MYCFAMRCGASLALAFLYALVLFAPARAQEYLPESAAQFFAADRERVRPAARTVRPPRRARDHSGGVTNMMRGVHPRLIAFARRFNCTIISGYRPGARVAGTRRLSNHARGLAIDVRGCARGAMVYARANGMGIGTYAPCTGHSHVHYSLVASERYHRSCRSKRRR